MGDFQLHREQMESYAIRIPKAYEIDWNKINSFEEMKSVLRNFPLYINDTHEEFENLKQYLKEVGHV